MRVHNVPAYLPIILFGIAIGVSMLAALAHLLQWDVVGAFFSRTAYLVYVILLTVVVGLLVHFWERSHK